MKISFLHIAFFFRCTSKISFADFLFPIISFALFFLTASTAFADLHGDNSLTYSTYHGKANSAAMSSTSLVQNYSLLYEQKGLVYNNRVGSYNVSLGYNWTALDTKFKSSSQRDDNYNEKRGHILYNGDILLDPKEVPFKLNIYSHDMHNNVVSTASMQGMPSFPSIDGNNFQATNINDGMHIESGATLVAGVKNGMTNGYNEFLRHFPMILIDYKDIINKDPRAVNPVDDRLSRLAFVSLNKKENWFHFRHTVYEDLRPISYDLKTGKINDDPSKNNYVENELQLGTVDQYMARRWIDFSNWIKVSTDIQFSKRKSNYQENAIEDINLNLFVTAERAKWNARTFTTFYRLKDENNNLSYQANMPLYLSGVIDKDTSWNARTVYRNNHDINNIADGVRTTADFTDAVVGYRVDTFKHSTFNLSQSLDAEASQTNDAEYLNLSGTIETTSTSRFSRELSLGASYNIKNMASSNLTTNSNLIEQSLALNGGYAVNNKLRFSLSQKNTFTSGSSVAGGNTVRDSQTQIAGISNPRTQLSNDVGNQTYQSLTNFSTTWTPIARLTITSTVIEDIYKTPIIGISPITEAFSTISFSNAKWTVSDSVKYMRGSREVYDDEQNAFSNSASIRYVHNRNLDGSASYSYNMTDPSAEERFRDSQFEQRINYNYFTKSGISRKLFELNETLLYADGTANNGRNLSKSLRLGFNYYPIRQLTLYAGAGYSITDRKKMNEYIMACNAGAVANFRLLQISLDYSHLTRQIDNAVEDRFTGNVRKSF